MLLVKAGMMMRNFYPSEILARIGISETELWDRYDVEESNWLALAAIFLTEIFSPAILIPLTENETRIQLQVIKMNHNTHSHFKLAIAIETRFKDDSYRVRIRFIILFWCRI